MLYKKWEPVYMKILNDFGWNIADDEKSALMLYRRCKDYDIQPYTYDELKSMIYGRAVIVIGNGPKVESGIAEFIGNNKAVVIVADSAIEKVVKVGIVPDLIVTDLDGDIQLIKKSSDKGSAVIIHAHGNNGDLIESVIGLFHGMSAGLTTQSVPFSTVYNFGGFTDGDRALFMSQELGAVKIYAYNFDFTKPYDNKNRLNLKTKKLRWAKFLIETFLPETIFINSTLI